MSDNSENIIQEKTKKVIQPKQWLEQLNQINISKFDLNKLVMNFFIVEGYKEAAENFAKESGTELSEYDIDFMNKRIKIKQLLHQGNIDDAIKQINLFNSDIFEQNKDLLIQLQLQKLIEIIKKNQIEQALEYAQQELLPKIKNDQKNMDNLEKVMCLLAFEDPSNSPLNELVDQSQRIKISSDVNNQLLKSSQNIEKESKLPILLKLLKWQQNKLSQFYEFPQISDIQTGQLEFKHQN